MPGDEQNVVIRAKLQDFDTAQEGISRLKEAISGLNSGYSAPLGSGGGGRLPSSAPASSAPIPNPYQHLPASGQSFSNPLGGGYGPPMSPSGTPQMSSPLPPGLLAPPAPGSGFYRYSGISMGNAGSLGMGGGMVPALGSGMSSSGTMTASVAVMNVMATTVNIVSTAVNGGGGGGFAGGGGSGGGGFGGFGGFGGAGTWANFQSAIISNPTGQGLFGAGLGMMGGGVAAAGMALAFQANAWQQSAIAGSAHVYSYQTQLQAAAAAGQYVRPQAAAQQMHAAEIEDRLARVRAIGSIADWIPGVGYNSEMSIYRPLQRQADLYSAYAQADTSRATLSGMLGRGVGRNEIPNGMANTALYQAQAVGMFGKSSTQSILDDINDPNASYSARNDLYGEQSFGPAAGAVGSLGARPGYSDITRGLMTGTSPRALAPRAAAYYAAQGDLSGIFSLLPYLNDQGIQPYLQQAAGVLETQGNLSIGAAGVSAAQSRVSQLTGTGATSQQVAGGMRRVGGALQGYLGTLQERLGQAVSPVDIAQISAQIAQVQAQIASLPQQISEMTISREQSTLGTLRGTAALGTQVATYGGSIGSVLGAIGVQAEAARTSAAKYRAEANKPGLPPERKAELILQAQQFEFQASTEYPRQGFQQITSNYSAGIGIQSAQVQSGITQAGLFGGPGEVYQAGLGQLGVIQSQQALVQYQQQHPELTSPQEKLDLDRQAIELKRQEIQVTQEVIRNYGQMSVSLAQTQQGITGTQVSRAFLLGAGGGSAVPLAQRNVSAAQQTLTAAQANVAVLRAQPGMTEDNPALQNAIQQAESAQTGVEQARLNVTQIPQPVNLRRAENAAQFQLNVMSRTYIPFGSMRQALGGLMSAGGEELRNINQIEQRMGAAGQLDDAAREQLEQRRYAVGERMVGYQQQYEQGWQDRLISSVYNAPSSFNIVASQFTAREAAPFLQNISPAFGFGGSQGANARDYYLFRGGRIASALGGNMARPDVFTARAASGSSGMYGGILAGVGAAPHAGSVPAIMGGSGMSSPSLPNGGVMGMPGPNTVNLNIEITLKDPAGNTIGKSSANKTAIDIGSGVAELIRSSFNATAGHQ
jgi:hypothetical protein